MGWLHWGANTQLAQARLLHTGGWWQLGCCTALAALRSVTVPIPGISVSHGSSPQDRPSLGFEKQTILGRGDMGADVGTRWGKQFNPANSTPTLEGEHQFWNSSDELCGY